MTVTWTSGYGISDAEPFVEWGPKGRDHVHSPAGTLTFTRDSLCGKKAKSYLWIYTAEKYLIFGVSVLTPCLNKYFS